MGGRCWLLSAPYEILADNVPLFLPRNVIDMTTKLIAGFGTIIRVHLQPSLRGLKEFLTDLWIIK